MTKIKCYLKKYETQIINCYFIIMSSIIISLFIYYRIIIKRAEYSLDLLKPLVTYHDLILCISLGLMHLFIILFLLKNMLTKMTNTNFLLNKVQIIANILIWKPLNFLLEEITPYIPLSGTLIIIYCEFFKKSELRVFFMKAICFLFYFLPKIIMSVIFFYEIIFNHSLEIFVKYFLVLLLPFIYILFLNICEKFYSNNIKEIEEGLIITVQGNPNQHGVYTKHKLQFNNKSKYPAESFRELVESWNILFLLLNFNAIIRLFISKTSSYVILVTSTLYLCAFSYKLYYLFII